MGVRPGMSFTSLKRPSEKTHTAVSCEEPRGRGPHSQISFYWTPPVWKHSLLSRGAANYGPILFSERRRYSTDDGALYCFGSGSGICPIGGFCMTGHFPGAPALGDKRKYLHVNSAEKYITVVFSITHAFCFGISSVKWTLTDIPLNKMSLGCGRKGKYCTFHLAPVAAPKRSGKRFDSWNIKKMATKLDAKFFGFLDPKKQQ